MINKPATLIHEGFPFFRAKRESKQGVVYITNEPAMQFDRIGRMAITRSIEERFKLACLGYEELHGAKASNDPIFLAIGKGLPHIGSNDG